MAIHRYKRPSLFSSFGHAFHGIGFAIRSERNMRIHLAATVCTIVAGLACKISKLDWMVLSVTLCLVLAAECINTAIEVTVDLSTRKTRYRAMLSKDLAAGGVLITALNAVIVGGFIFGPYLIHFLKGCVTGLGH